MNIDSIVSPTHSKTGHRASLYARRRHVCACCWPSRLNRFSELTERRPPCSSHREETGINTASCHRPSCRNDRRVRGLGQLRSRAVHTRPDLDFDSRNQGAESGPADVRRPANAQTSDSGRRSTPRLLPERRRPHSRSAVGPQKAEPRVPLHPASCAAPRRSKERRRADAIRTGIGPRQRSDRAPDERNRRETDADAQDLAINAHQRVADHKLRRKQEVCCRCTS